MVAFRCEAYDGKSNFGGYGNLAAKVASILLLSEAMSSGVHTNTVTPSVSTWCNLEIEATGPLVLLDSGVLCGFSC